MRKLICMCVILLLLLPARASDAPKYIALTFDDGPSGHFTTNLLEGLAQREVHATFFLCGYRVEQFPDLTAQIAAQGHEIGIHGDKHTLFSQMTAGEVCADLAQCMQKIENACGQRPTLLRPPGGLYDTQVLKQTCCNDLPIILWSVDVQDWNRSNSYNIAKDVAAKAKNGDIILMHDIKDSSVNAALRIIDMLQERGFEFVTVSELAYLSCTSMKGSTVYHQFKFEKKASTSSLEAPTEPCTKFGFPPPRPFKDVLRLREKSFRSSVRLPMA